MRKLLFTTALLATISGTAQAAESKFTWNPYVGFDLLRLNLDYKDDGDELLGDNLGGFNIHLGVRPHVNFGAELGYFRTSEEKKDITAALAAYGLAVPAGTQTGVKASGFTLDAMAYLPVADRRVDLIGTAGISHTKAELSFSMPALAAVKGDESEFGFRGGAGAQVNLDGGFNLRGLARYQSADFDDVADGAWSYTIGLNYGF